MIILERIVEAIWIVVESLTLVVVIVFVGSANLLVDVYYARFEKPICQAPVKDYCVVPDVDTFSDRGHTCTLVSEDYNDFENVFFGRCRYIYKATIDS